MRLVALYISIVLIYSSSAQASVLDEFEELMEVDTLFNNSIDFDLSGNCSSCSTSCSTTCCPSDCSVPMMIGDGGLLQPRVISSGSRLFYMQNHVSKVSENNSALPQDRIGVNFSALQDVSIGRRGGSTVIDNLQEYRFFVEKTIFDGAASLEFFVPIYNSTESQITTIQEFGVGPQVHGEFGDLAFGIKGLLHNSDSLAVSLGLRVEAPTRQDVLIENSETRLNDDVWHFTPYLAMQSSLTPNLFVNGFAAYRLNSTTMNASSNAGTNSIREPTYLMVDGSVGYWLIRRPHRRGLTGLASILELHYTTTPEREDLLRREGIPTTGVALGHTDYLNLTAGLTSRWNERVSVTGAFAVPLRSNAIYSNNAVIGPTDRTYDWSFLLNLDYKF